jgi:CRP/FNR family nitrogen fixation transcriptional regulator
MGALVRSISKVAGRNVGIYREGDPVGQLYRVISGAVRTSKVLTDGRRQIGAFYLPGEICQSAGSAPLVSSGRRSVSPGGG